MPSQSLQARTQRARAVLVRKANAFGTVLDERDGDHTGNGIGHERLCGRDDLVPAQPAFERAHSEILRLLQYPAAHDARDAAPIEHRRHQIRPASDEQVRHGAGDDIAVDVAQQSLPNAWIGVDALLLSPAPY